MDNPFFLTGNNLGVSRLVRLSSDNSMGFKIPCEAMDRIEAARIFVDKAIDHGQLVYGLTTGLGARVTEVLTREELADFSYQTLRGRANALGNPLSREVVRGAMIIRLNTMMKGTSGVSPEVAEHIVRCLNSNITPVVPEVGSIGASDLLLGATMGLAFIGEGMMHDVNGRVAASADVMKAANISILKLGPKDGLALANHSSFSASMSAFSVFQSNQLFARLQAASAMTMEAMRANLTPIQDDVVRLGQHESHIQTAFHLRQLLKGSSLESGSETNKVQDPLSIRNIVQVHGSLLTAIQFSRSTVNAEVNSVTDNPVVEFENQRVVSAGGYLSSELTLSIETLARALDMSMVTLVARISKLASSKHSQLPLFLASPGAGSNGFAPAMKIAEALLSKIKRCLQPVSLWPSINADGVEDILCHSFERAQSVVEALGYCQSLVSLEVMMASQGLELSDRKESSSERIQQLYSWVRERVEPLVKDRPLASDLGRLTTDLFSESFPLSDRDGFKQ